MITKILHLLLILSSSILIYLGNTSILTVNIFLLIVLSTLNKNYFSLLSIIPLFFINKNVFLLFIFIWILLFISNRYIKKNITKNMSTLLVCLTYFCYELFIIEINPAIILSILTITSLLLILNLCNETLSKNTNTSIFILCISVLNLGYISTYVFLILYTIFIVVQSIENNKSYYLISSFFITIYAIYTSQELIYILIQIIAYLGYLFSLVINKNKYNNTLEYVLEDINLNITNFCVFLEHFSNTSFDNEYEKKVSSSIRILIESYCFNCKNRHICYAGKKMKTYIFLKELLTKEKQINSKNEANNFFECIYYNNIAEKALYLQKQYNLISDTIVDNSKMFGIYSSIQNYFISMVDKISPKMIHLINFKKFLIEQNVRFTQFEYSIINETVFHFKIYSKSITTLLDISNLAKTYFKKQSVDITINENYVSVTPFKKYKVIYDSASLSLNNCQISGDNILLKTTNGINFLCALSDGMGSGFHAYQLSEETIKMVNNITDCNISFDAALQILNNFFRTRNLADSYATLDLIDINLAEGILSLYKLGSSTTYISRGNKIIPIYNNNLPFGLSDLITKEEFSVSDGDLIILVSDGINDYIDESVLLNYINTIKDESPHKIVYEILQKIYYENGNQIKDDMSCVAIKLNSIN